MGGPLKGVPSVLVQLPKGRSRSEENQDGDECDQTAIRPRTVFALKTGMKGGPQHPKRSKAEDERKCFASRGVRQLVTHVLEEYRRHDDYQCDALDSRQRPSRARPDERRRRVLGDIRELPISRSPCALPLGDRGRTVSSGPTA